MIDFNDLTPIGHAPVDSGTIWVGDPCYLVDLASWLDFLKPLRSRTGAGAAAEAGDGVHAYTAHGDGRYPVYAVRDRQGRNRALLIDFDGVIPDAEEDDDGR